MNNTNEKIWKTVKPFLSDKATTFPTISWVQNDEIISDEPDFTWFQISFEIKNLKLLLRNTSTIRVSKILKKILQIIKHSFLTN